MKRNLSIREIKRWWFYENEEHDRKAVLLDVATHDIKTLLDELERLKEIIEFYAEPLHWIGYGACMFDDRGEKARLALENLNKPEYE